MRCYLSLLLTLLCVGLTYGIDRTESQPYQEEEVRDMKVKGVMLDPQTNTPVVVLAERHGSRAFAIWIGMPEARAIALEMEGVSAPRPLTHVLLKNIVVDLGARVTHVVITDMRQNTFYAHILLRQGERTFRIDARPSDAIVLALHAQVPIFAAKKLFDVVQTITLPDAAVPLPSTKMWGMHLQNLDATLASFFSLTHTEGALVASVDTGSPAERHGVRRGDVITDIDGKHIKDAQELLMACRAKKEGQEVVLQVTRDRSPFVIRLPFSALD